MECGPPRKILSLNPPGLQGLTTTVCRQFFPKETEVTEEDTQQRRNTNGQRLIPYNADKHTALVERNGARRMHYLVGIVRAYPPAARVGTVLLV